MGRKTEALPGGRTFREVEEIVRRALGDRLGPMEDGRWMWVRDLTDEWVVYEVEGDPGAGLFRAGFSIDSDGKVTLGGAEPVQSKSTYVATEATVPVPGRVLEAKGTDDVGGRVFRFRLIEADQVGKNLRRYPRKVLESAVGLYEGAKAYDRHRSDDDMRSSTIAGLVGAWRNVSVGESGLDADLHLLPSAVHTAEAIEFSLAQQASGAPPLVGSSHDVYGNFAPVVEGGQRLSEATEIVSVNSADVVADPAAGGRVTRMVAGGTDPQPEESAMPTFEELIELVTGATPEQKASLADSLGLKAPEPAQTATTPDPAPADPEPKKVLVGAAAESVYAKSSLTGTRLVRDAIEAQGFAGERVGEAVQAVLPALPDQFTEANLVELLALAKPRLELMGLAPTVVDVSTVKESLDRKRDALDAMFITDPSNAKFGSGYRSFKEAFIDVTGVDTRKFSGPTSEDFNRYVLRESMRVPEAGGWGFFDSTRATESATTATWAEILGDSIARRMVAEYGLMQLSSWRSVVSSVVPVSDFRTQRITRLGGYGTLPAVGQGDPYQALTTPGDEEATYAITKRGGTEDLTLEAIANDDMRLVSRIPVKLGRAAAQTLYRFVWDLLRTNATCTYDATALFAAGHGTNTVNPLALSQTALSTGRRTMREQTAFGDASEVLGATPRTLVVPPELEEIGFQLVSSAVAVPATPAGPSDTPNIHSGLNLVVVDYFSDADDWYLVADPALVPTIEVGFYQGRQQPELFAQSDPTQGSVFTADKFTWKIRHIYSAAILDHRGFFRGQGS